MSCSNCHSEDIIRRQMGRVILKVRTMFVIVVVRNGLGLWKKK